ncbi:winged helix-turn-helix domain-containing protein, partial [Acinetobacter baumannii]
TISNRSSSGYATWRLIADQLRSEILDGTLSPDARLPTEAERAARFGVNRNTVSQALSTLAGEELIVTRQGVGTFVVPHTVL